MEYKEYFNSSLQKFRELKDLGALKSAHSQLDKIITLLTGIKKPKVTTSPIKDVIDIESFDEPKPNLFANLKLKVPNPVKESEVKTGSSFSFIKKEAKKDLLENLDLDFTLINAPSSKPQNLLDTAFGTLEEPVLPPAAQRTVKWLIPDINLAQPPLFHCLDK